MMPRVSRPTASQNIVSVGVIAKDDPKEVAHLIASVDPDGGDLILFAAAQPCPDLVK